MPGRERIVEAVSALPSTNVLADTPIVEALSALGEIEPVRTLAEIEQEICAVLGRPRDPQAWRAAGGIYSNQFEDDLVGPYHEAVAALAADDRRRLVAMALMAADDGVVHMHARWMLSE